MMGAIGTGNTREGVITASFGTSGTIYACAESPVVDPEGEIAAFCDSTNQWLPLLCTMNVTVATEMVRQDFEWTHETFASKAAAVPPGARGLLLLPYLEGERTPNIPDGTGVMIGINQQTFSASHYARAAMEGVTLGMNYGLRRLAELGVKPTQIRATGGGAKSKVWRQIMADVFNAEVVTLKVSEGAAYGAALQALWCWRRGKRRKGWYQRYHRRVCGSESNGNRGSQCPGCGRLPGVTTAAGRDLPGFARRFQATSTVRLGARTIVQVEIPNDE
jgi:sugar (pentulose or hexulose) kinase